MNRRIFLASASALACVGGRTPSPAPPAAGRPPLPAHHHRGMSYAHLHVPGRGYGSDRSRQELAKLAALGVTHVALMPFAYLPSIHGPELRTGGDPTLGAEALRRESAVIRQLGMVPVLKPHLWAREFGSGKFAGDIAMPDAASWQAFFRAYADDYVLPLARVAAEAEVGLFVVGTELAIASRENPGAFAALAARVREVFAGPLTYAAHWDAEPEGFADWSAMDFVGVNAYFPLAGDPTTEALVAAWQPHLARMAALHAKTGKPILYTEAGYPAVATGHVTPWDAEGPPDDGLQARAYEALLATHATAPWFSGVYWWKWFTAGAGNTWDRSPFCPDGKPAEQVLARWFAR